MKILTLPDLHGKDIWTKIDFARYDKVIFVGDYVDSSTHTDLEILDNLRAIIEFKKTNEAKVELLLGNHDIQYLFQNKYRCDGHRLSMDEVLHTEYAQNQELFKYIFQLGNHVWTHAGISNTWFNQVKNVLPHYGFESNPSSIHVGINILARFEFSKLVQTFSVRGGSEKANGIFFADKKEMEFDNLIGVHQYVGHSRVSNISRHSNKYWEIHFLDCLDTTYELLEIELSDVDSNYEPKYSIKNVE